jgi:RHS repeat-associated protein
VWRKFTFSAITTSKIRVQANATTDGWSRVTELEAWGNAAAPPRTNVALSANGASASASSVYSPSQGPGYSAIASEAINGDRTGRVNSVTAWWNDGTQNAGPDWLQVDFNGSKTIDEIDVFTAQDNYTSPSEPTEAMTFSVYGLTGYDVQYWNGSAWVNVTGGSVSGNNKVWRTFTFAAITTSKIRVQANATTDGWSRVTELEAWTASSSGNTAANINWLVTDQLGTPRLVFDQTGSLAATKRHDYLPFGEELFTGGRTTALGYGVADNVRQKFTSKERDNETALDYFGARYYSSTQGRFTSPDPLYYQFMMAIDPQLFNLYTYTRNNPFKFVDPSGEKVTLTGDQGWLRTNVLYEMAGGQENFERYFEVKDGQVTARSGVDSSSANAGVQELLGLVNASENYVYFAGTDGGAVADLFQGTRDGKGRLTDAGKLISNRFTCDGRLSGCGTQGGTTGRPNTDQPANLANGDAVFAVIALNTKITMTEIDTDYRGLNPVPGDVKAAQEAGVGQVVRPVSFFIHESTENQMFAKQGAGKMDYAAAHAHANVREAAIGKALNISGGFAGAFLNTEMPKKH